MPNIKELDEFTADVPLLELDTPVLGYDGMEIGPSNEQAQVLANRTKNLKRRIDSMNATQVRSVNGKSGAVVLTANDVDADAAGTADGLLTSHINDPDPHAQYFDETRGDARYVQVSLANTGGGWLQLDASGRIPAALLQTLTSRYVVVVDQSARLALASSSNLTICAQADIDTLFYLNGGDDPAVETNWVRGQAATVSGVSSVHGRTGEVTAQVGDYSADQINETTARKFVSPTEKAAWNAKQATLVSGQNIRSLFGQSLLGTGNLTLTPTQMGAAAAQHTHLVTDITDFAQQAQALIIGSLEAGPGVALGQNPVSGKTIISATGGGSGGGGYIVVDRPGATAGQNHSFGFSSQSAFNLTAYALKEVAGAANQTHVVDDFNASSQIDYNLTDNVYFDGLVRLNVGGIFPTISDGDFFTHQLDAAKLINVSTSSGSPVIPAMTSNTSPLGYVVSASSYWGAVVMPYRAFDGVRNSADGACWASAKLPTAQSPEWIRIDLPAPVTISAYQILNRFSGVNGNLKSWIMQGSNDNGVTWNNIHQIAGDNNTANGLARNFTLSSPVTYKSYRWYITEVNSNYATIEEISLFVPPQKVIFESAGDLYTVYNNQLLKINAPLSTELIDDSGVESTGNVDVSALPQIKIISNQNTQLTIKIAPLNQIVIPASLNSAKGFEKINSATLAATQTNNGFVRVSVTRDLVNWHVWRGGVWVDIGPLSADTTSATKLITNGMTPSDLNGINTAGWMQLFSSNNGIPDYLAFAFALAINDPAADVATIDRLTNNVNEASSWKLQTPAEVEINWRTDSVTFRTVTAGNYKLAYQIP